MKRLGTRIRVYGQREGVSLKKALQMNRSAIRPAATSARVTLAETIPARCSMQHAQGAVRPARFHLNHEVTVLSIVVIASKNK